MIMMMMIMIMMMMMMAMVVVMVMVVAGSFAIDVQVVLKPPDSSIPHMTTSMANIQHTHTRVFMYIVCIYINI